MPLQVKMGAQIKCTFGSAPTVLSVIPKKVHASGPAATIMDKVTGVNIATFGMCNSPNNPAVIAATAAAMGVFTPAPCVPVCPAPWAPGSPTVLNQNIITLHQPSKVMCCWAGMISVINPGQVKVQVK
ncbi:MAG: DUF4280 domain-containing protein [Polyangiaceae bacterium]|nr:DUF4280 domain-containing protein [Polyangiaceae bacterium]